MKCSEITIRAFMSAMFNKQYDGVGGEENWDAVYTEYIDLSGISQTKEFNLLTNIHNIQLRLSKVQGLVDIQKKFFAVFDCPFDPAIHDLKKYGHRLTWDIANPQQFILQLQVVEIKEKRNVAELDKLIKELESIKKDGVKVDNNARLQFVLQLTRLGKEGYKIDKDKTDVEELAVMIKEYSEEMEQRLLDNDNKKNK